MPDRQRRHQARQHRRKWWTGSANLIAIFENKALDLSKNRAHRVEADDILKTKRSPYVDFESTFPKQRWP